MSSIYTLSKVVPMARLQAYLNMGWTRLDVKAGTYVVVRKEIHTDLGKDTEYNNIQSEMQVLQPPYLIQRGLIVRPLGKHRNDVLSDAVHFDYMGSAEFEFGALPMSLRRVEAQFMLYKHIVFSDIVAEREGKLLPLRMYANFDSDVNRETYKKNLLDVFQWNRRLKEHIGLEYHGNVLKFAPNCDFWWDIDNDLFFCFDKQYMSGLETNIKSSFDKMNIVGDNHA
jgi:hypothetical protein